MEHVRSRRDEYSDASRRALLESARTLFTARGFAATSLDEVAADARLTKGAVYHHFENKQALFEAVLDELEEETVGAILGAAGAYDSVWEGGLAGLDTFLDKCLEPTYQRLCFQEGPVALGFVRWWECGERHEIGLIKALLQALRSDGLLDVENLDVLTRILYGSLAAGALAIARADDPKAERDAIRDVVVRTIEGLRPPRTARPTAAPRRPRRNTTKRP